MKSFRFKILIILSFILANGNTFGQTYIGPVTGLDYSRMSLYDENPFGFYFLEKGFVNESPFIGLKLEQIIYHGFYLSYQMDYNQKKAIASDNGFLPIDCINFNYFRHKISLKYLFKNLVYVGFGAQYNLIRNMKFLIDNQIIEDSNINEVGTNLSIGIKYKSFDLGIYYLNGLSTNRPRQYPSHWIRPISSYGFQLSYDLKVFDKFKLFNKKGQRCPAF